MESGPRPVSSPGSIASGIAQWKCWWLIIAILLGHGAKVRLEDNEPDVTTPARCHHGTQATNSEFHVGRVYVDVPLNLAQLDADVDVQDKFIRSHNASGIVLQKCWGHIAI